jgi:ribosome recycling factor
MNEDVLKEIESRMLGATEAFKISLKKLRTGRASLAVVDGVSVDYYGSATPLNQVASLSVPDPTTITIAPWEPGVLAAIEKAILKSNLGLTPNNDGKVIRLNIPPLTEERRRGLVKIAQGDAENARNQIRQIRRDGNDEFKTMERDKEISEDEMRDGQEAVQKLTDSYVGRINDILKRKEAEILDV